MHGEAAMKMKLRSTIHRFFIYEEKSSDPEIGVLQMTLK